MDKLRADLVRSIRGQFPELTLHQIDTVVVAFLNQLKEEINEGNTVNLYSFGKFSTTYIFRERRFNALLDQYEDEPVEYTKICFKSSNVWKNKVNNRE